jgi:putative solute:sodium symporter small subunit
MDKATDDYHISFFKPTTPQAVANRNLVVWFVLIWFTAIFGFQILLRIIQKPTPEPAYISYEQAWSKLATTSFSDTDLQELGQATLSVLGKLSATPEDTKVLNQAMSWTIYQLTPESKREALVEKVSAFESLKAELQDISDPEYIAMKKAISGDLSPLLGISPMDVRSKILPLSLSSENIAQLSDQTKGDLPVVMKKYLVHNQSFLTDWKFLGFPFHYFYTAIFLLILFVGLCWLYCFKIDSLNKKLQIVD